MRLRVTFAKQGALRWTGHLDLHRIWERSVRRSGLPLSYSQGFHPQPKIQIATALPLGFLGREEVVDLWLEDESRSAPPPDGALPTGDDWSRRTPEIHTRLQAAVPPGLFIRSVEVVDPRGPALQVSVLAAEYDVLLLDAIEPSDLAARLAGLLGAGSLLRERRGKPYDLRPLIEMLEARDPDKDGRARLYMRLAAREGATGRPEEVLDALGIPFEAARIERTRLLFLRETVK